MACSSDLNFTHFTSSSGGENIAGIPSDDGCEKAETHVLRHGSKIRVYEDKTWSGIFATEMSAIRCNAIKHTWWPARLVVGIHHPAATHSENIWALRYALKNTNCYIIPGTRERKLLLCDWDICIDQGVIATLATKLTAQMLCSVMTAWQPYCHNPTTTIASQRNF